MRRSLAVGAAAIAALTLSLTVWAQAGGALTLPWFSADGGGGTSTSAGGDFTLDGTIGQPDAGRLEGRDFTVEGGFIPGVTVPPAFAVTCGDLNGDGDVNIIDVIIKLQIIVRLIEPTEQQLISGDETRDGIIDIFDAIMELQHIVGLIEITECGPPPP